MCSSARATASADRGATSANSASAGPRYSARASARSRAAVAGSDATASDATASDARAASDRTWSASSSPGSSRRRYLLAAVPEGLGGSGLALDQVLRLQQRLAYHAPATAIAVNMHLYWTGLAADLARFGDERCAFILREAAAGHVFAAGHGEAGNAAGLFAATTQAERVDGGWVFTGRKVFGSLSPVWTYLGLHGMDTSDPADPKVVHAFMPRDTEGYRIEETWDALGMRATASHDTVLDRAFVPDHLAPVVVPAGARGADLFHLSLFAWGLLGFASVYAGVAHRA